VNNERAVSVVMDGGYVRHCRLTDMINFSSQQLQQNNEVYPAGNTESRGQCTLTCDQIAKCHSICLC